MLALMVPNSENVHGTAGQANFQRVKGGLSNLSLDGMNQLSCLWRLPVLLATNISPGERWHWPCGMARSGALARPPMIAPPMSLFGGCEGLEVLLLGSGHRHT